MATRTYAIGDLHGRYDLLEKALDWIEADRDGDDGVRIVFLGDYIDRGPQSRSVVERLIKGPKRPDDTFVCLMGNYEEMLLRAVDLGGAAVDTWLDNGGDATLRSYWGEVSPEHIAWMRTLPNLVEDQHRVFVHAGLHPKRSIADQRDYHKLWIREPFLTAGHDFGKHVVHGHTPVRDGPDLDPHRTNLDTGSFFTGRQAIAVLDDDMPGGPIRTAIVTAEV